MDPNVCLARLRLKAQRIVDTFDEGDPAYSLAEQFLTLDHWLKDMGGFAPDDWVQEA